MSAGRNEIMCKWGGGKGVRSFLLGFVPYLFMSTVERLINR